LKRYLFFLFSIFIVFSCKTDKKNSSIINQSGDTLSVTYAKGFSIVQYEGYKIVNVKNPWPEANKTYRYLLVENESKVPSKIKYDHRINIPVSKIVVTSTTHIPSLEALNQESSLVGFPGLNYISSEKTRELIKENKITELGKNEAINTEVLISLEPDVVIGFAVNGNNKTFNTIEKSGIPVVYNGDWIEESPLGKAEWIKFFGAFFNRSEEAEQLFKEVETAYNDARELARSAAERPSVLSGSMFKDQWYVPYGNAWQAQFIKDANAEYIYANTKGSGSMALAFETVLSEAQNTKFWIAPGQFKSYEHLMETSAHYKQFDAVKNLKVFTYSNTTGETGGVLYYELAPNRPDLVLKDLISIFHPELLPDYETTFFKPLK
jgi:iron complex transport system substrate-binding protein